MKKNQIIYGASIVLFIAIVAYFLTEKRRREDELKDSLDREKDLADENKVLKNMVTDLKSEVKEIIDNKDELPENIKAQLRELIEEYKDIDQKITNELLSVTALIEIKENTKAILSLTKIIENLLKQLYSKDNKSEETSKLKIPRFVDLINYAKSRGFIEKDEFHFLNGIREVRNEEAHNLNVKKEGNIISTSFLIGISLIFKLAGKLKLT